MRFDKIEKVHEGAFIDRYNVSYTTQDQRKKVYEIISRNKDLKTLEDLHNPHTDGVVIIMTDAGGEKILLGKEFRMAVGECVYNFPAGLIDSGEYSKEAAARELREETGLEIVEIADQLYDSYSAIGFSNETNAVVIGTAAGTFAPSTSTMEEIQAGWYTKEEVKNLLKNKHFAAKNAGILLLVGNELRKSGKT